MKFLLLFSALISLNSFSKDFSLEKCEKFDKKEVLKEAVIRELLGASLSAKPKCLTTYPFKYTQASWFPPSEGERIFDYGVDLSSLKVIKTELIEEFTGQYKITFEVKSTKQFGSKVFTDSMTVATKLESSLHEEQGCSMMMSKPQNYFLASICYAQTNKKGGE